MPITTIPLRRLESDLKGTLTACADSGAPLVVELPDRRLIAIQALEPAGSDSLADDLVASNPAFRDLLARSRSAARKPFGPRKEE